MKICECISKGEDKIVDGWAALQKPAGVPPASLHSRVRLSDLSSRRLSGSKKINKRAKMLQKYPEATVLGNHKGSYYYEPDLPRFTLLWPYLT